jgi:hypothetical protein
MKKQKGKKSLEPLDKGKLERLELALKILKLVIEIPLVATVLIIGIDKILKL